MRTLEPTTWQTARLIVLATALLLAVPAGAQETVRGVVIDARTGFPLADALVRSGTATTRSNARGRFAAEAASGGWLVAIRIGYRPDSIRYSTGAVAMIRLEPAPPTLVTIIAAGGGVPTEASGRNLTELDLALRPHDSAQELLRLAPGLVIAQHGGGGKAEQIFLRGFDADHGTDVAISVDGTPVNIVSHAHGQGYADLHFLLPEVVEGVDVRKGPFDVRDGNLATAGAVAFRTRDRVPHVSSEVRGGAFGTASARAVLPFGGGAERLGGYFAAAVAQTDGPFLAAQNYERTNLFGRMTAPLAHNVEVVVTASAFDARWDASGQLPARAVRSGAVSRFGAIDPSEGGSTARGELSIALRTREAGTEWQARVYAVGYRFDLFSNFTFFVQDSINGDGIAQHDVRQIAGGQVDLNRDQRVFGIPGRMSALAGVRHDDASVRLAQQSGRVIRADRLTSDIIETHSFVGVRQDLALGSRVHVEASVRADLIAARVVDRTSGGATNAVRPDGARAGSIVSPRLGIGVNAGRDVVLHASVGTGFHSNDARDVVQARDRSVLPRAVGAEAGVRKHWRRATAALAVWALDLESELVFVGDEGITEPSGRTRRLGIDLEGRVQLLPMLWLDADLNLAHGRLRDAAATANRIPLAPPVTASAGLTWRDAGPVKLSGRVRHIGARAADETGDVIAHGSTIAEVAASWQLGGIALTLSVDNLFNVEWNEAQFATTSRLRGEPAPVTELHFTPGANRAVQLGARVTL